MSTQSLCSPEFMGRSYPNDTGVLEEGLKRVFVVEPERCFDDLIVAIDIADESMRGVHDCPDRQGTT